MITAVIVDDEPKAVALTKLMLEKYYANDVQVVGTANEVDTAFELINRVKPQLLFLDVELTNATGFDLLLKFEHHFFQIVFVTAFAGYAVQAIKHSAIDYLLKPIAPADLGNAIQKAKKAIGTAKTNNEVENLLNLITKPNNKSNKIRIAHEKGFTMLAVETIMYLEASNNYTIVHCVNNDKLTTSTHLSTYEQFLKDYDFFRVHHSYIVNKEYIHNYLKGDGGEVELTNKVRITVSRRKKAEFLHWLYP